MTRTTVLILALSSSGALSAADQETDTGSARGHWPAWRGPLATGVAPDATPPLEWSESKNIRWKRGTTYSYRKPSRQAVTSAGPEMTKP